MTSLQSESGRQPVASTVASDPASASTSAQGAGLAAISQALNKSETFLAKLQARLIAVFRRPPEPEPEPAPRATPDKLRFSDLDLDDPGHALQALRRAARVPPHRRHIELPPGD